MAWQDGHTITKCVACTKNLIGGPALSVMVQNQNTKKLECGPMPNVMVALPNIGGALCSTPQSLADAHYYM